MMLPGDSMPIDKGGIINTKWFKKKPRDFHKCDPLGYCDWKLNLVKYTMEQYRKRLIGKKNPNDAVVEEYPADDWEP